MENLPVEVIGNILSRLKAAKDVVVASVTCKKWREACRTHVHTISFNSNDWSDYLDFSTTRLEIIITQTILQTTGLQTLTIYMDDVHDFSAASLIAWLMNTRDTLRQLHYCVRTSPIINIIEKCGVQKLEVLILAYNSIIGVEPTYQRFPCLKNLSLVWVRISALDLSLLLVACPKLEFLALRRPNIVMSDEDSTMDEDLTLDEDSPMELSSSSLKSIALEYVNLEKFILDADILENLHLKDCFLNLFKLISKGKLRALKLDNVRIDQLDVGENLENLEIVDISKYEVTWPKLYQMISKAPKLRKLQLWNIGFEDEEEEEEEVVNLESMSVCFPHLNHLSLCYGLSDEDVNLGLQGNSRFENLNVLKLGWTTASDLFLDWVVQFVERCPNLKKLIIYGVISEIDMPEVCIILADFMTSFVQLMRKYMHVEVQFEFEWNGF